MISKDADLIAEAYLSALQKSPNFTADPGMKSIAAVNPEVTDRENVENKPSAVVVSVPAGPEAAMDEPAVSPNVEDEREEHWMARTNLFSLYSDAKKIHNAIQEGLDLEPWMQQKIAVCADNLQAVMKSVAYRMAEKGMGCGG